MGAPASRSSSRRSKTMTSPIVALIALVFIAISIAILWLSVSSLPTEPAATRITRRGRSLFLHLALLIAPPFVNGFAFLPLFADHPPFPRPFDNLQFLAAVELIGLAVIYGFVLRGLGRLYGRWSFNRGHRRALLVLLGLVFATTMLPVILAATLGPA